MSIRQPRGYGKTSWGFQHRFEDGTTPSYNTNPLSCLPVFAIDEHQDDAVVLPPGTFVGRLNSTDHSALDPSFLVNDPIAPACPTAYKLSYGSLDLADAYGAGTGTPDIDEDSDTIVAAAGDGTTEIQPVKPLGIIYRPYYASWIKDRFTNYEPYMLQTWVTGRMVVRIPCITAGECAIQPGDKVMLNDGATPKWNPGDLVNSLVGRVEAFDGDGDNLEYVVGRCQNKYRIAKQASTSAGQRLSAALRGAPRNPLNIDQSASLLYAPEGNAYQVNAQIEGVPGMDLSVTSAMLGRSAEEGWAHADSNGDFWAVDILLNAA